MVDIIILTDEMKMITRNAMKATAEKMHHGVEKESRHVALRCLYPRVVAVKQSWCNIEVQLS
jgi:hypothetical protein